MSITVIEALDLTAAQRPAVWRLQEHCFAAMPVTELVENFVAKLAGSVLAEEAGELVGCLSVVRRAIVDAGRTIVLGCVGGTCTRPDRRGRGLGFVPLARPFTIVDVHGRTRLPSRPHSGMLAPVGSPECVARIAHGTGPLHLGPAVGDW